MLALNLTTHRNLPVQLHPFQIALGNRQLLFSETLDFGKPIGIVEVGAVARAAEHFARLSDNTCAPQLAALVFDAGGHPRALDWYFPITNFLTPDQLTDFDSLRDHIANHATFGLRLVAEHRADVSSLMPASVRGIVAGHLAEIFFFRRDILERFLSSPRHILLYTTSQAFKHDGGEAGGNYHLDRECVQLVLSRLFEGYNGDTPGVAPFLHEFGHMLDHFDAGAGRMGKSAGFLPGLRLSDGDLFTPRARELFLLGKHLEYDRYLARYIGLANPRDPFPIGHPYVFQNDTEFIAGYFEMFFRNPHYFAELNPNLFNSLAELFDCDTRRAWKQDFQFYINENRKFYVSGERPWKPGLTVL